MINWCVLLVILVTLGSCKSEYQQYVDREMQSAEVHDSLIFGMKLGDSRKDFFSICWDLNKQKIISQGTGNQYALYRQPLDSTRDMTYRTELQFYGIFDENEVMRGMDMIYNYVSWALWNDNLQSDSLAYRLQDTMIAKYGGNDFIDIELPSSKSKAYVKIDANRQITIFPKNTKDVAVKIEDLRYKLSK